MKLFLYSLFLTMALIVSPIAHEIASAHELLPKEVIDYIQANPNASPDDIQRFVESTSPELAAKYQNQSELVDVIKNQNIGFWHNGYLFIKLGIEHILSGPDHILFVLSLLLAYTVLRKLLKLTASFTIAHSITLILAGTGILTLSSRVVEPIIALSIAYVALSSVFLKNTKYAKLAAETAPAVFLFGLFHGLGFAGLLEEIQVPENRFISSLLFFNVGIELGQIFIILLALPLVYYFRDKSWYPKAMKVVAAIFAAIAIYWTIQRVFF
jgi:hydrogenase/urease accessory protein HupE